MMKLVSEHKEPFALAQLQGSRYPLPNMAPIPPFVARVTETHRGVELHTKHGHELLTVSSRTKKAPKWSFPGKRTGDPRSGTEVGHYSFDDPHRDINGRYQRDPRWSMTPFKESRSGSLPPGPGRYNNRDGVLRESAPSWSFGSTSKGARAPPLGWCCAHARCREAEFV
eukprot:symbB.v1.2.001764.t1/scaffold95.1/size600632/12